MAGGVPSAGWLRALALAGLAYLSSLASCKDANDSLQLVGSVERTLVELSASGSEVIVSLPVQRGQHVEVGDTVVQLDRTLTEAEVARAEAASGGARTRLSVTHHDLGRADDLGRRKIIAEDEREHARLAWEEADARLREADARLAMAHKRLADMTIAAPVAGVVDQLPYELGERVPAGAVVAVILQDEAPWVRIWVPEPSVVRLSPGMAAEVGIDGFSRRFPGRILDVAREPEFTPHYALTERERGHLVYEARVELGNAPAELRPGTAATVVIRLAERAAQEGS